MIKEPSLNLIDELLQENNQLKSANNTLRLKIQCYQQCLMGLAFQTTNKYVTHLPLKELPQFCLKRAYQFLEQFENKCRNVQQKQIEIKHLYFLSEINNERTKLEQERQLKQILRYQKLQEEKREMQLKFLIRIKQLQQEHHQYQKLRKQLQRKQIQRRQGERVIISAAIHRAQQDIEKARYQIGNSLKQECDLLSKEIRNHQANVKSFVYLLRKLLKKGCSEEENLEDYRKILQFIDQMDDIVRLNQINLTLKADNLSYKKEVKQLQSKKNQQDQKICQISQQKRKAEEHSQHLQLQLYDKQRLIDELHQKQADQKKVYKQLQSIIYARWDEQYEKLRRQFQQVYLRKIKLLIKQFQSWKEELSIKANTFEALHTQKEVTIQTLKIEIEVLQDQIVQHKQIITELEVKNTDLQVQLKESNLMFMEYEQNISSETEAKIKEREQKIKELKDQINSVQETKQLFEKKMKDLKKNLHQHYQAQKRKCQTTFVHEKEQAIKKLQEQQQKLLAHKQNIHRVKEETMRKQFEALNQTNVVKHRLQIQNLEKQLQTCKKLMKQSTLLLQQSETTHRNSFQTQRNIFQAQISKLKKQSSDKTIIIKSLHQRMKNDETLKRQLNHLLDLKIRQCNQLRKAKQNYIQLLSKKEQQIKQLIETNMNKSMENVVNQLRRQFHADLQLLKEKHWKQMQLSKSKISQLQSILCYRQIFQNNRMIALCQQKEILEQTLQQFDRRQREKTEHSLIPTQLTPINQKNLSSINFIKPRQTLLLNRKRKSTSNRHKLAPNQSENRSALNIIEVKRSLIRNRELSFRQYLQSQHSSNFRTSPKVFIRNLSDVV